MTGCGVSQLPGVKVRVDGERVTCGLSDAGVTVTLPAGCVFSATVYVALWPGSNRSVAGVTVSPGSLPVVSVSVLEGSEVPSPLMAETR